MSFYNVVARLNGTSLLNEMTTVGFAKEIGRSVRVVAVAFTSRGASPLVRVTRFTRFSLDARHEGEKDEGRAREKGWLPRRMSLGVGVCPPGRGERAVTERDGVTKEGTRDGVGMGHTPSPLFPPSSVFCRKRGRTDTVPMETRRRLPPKILGPSTCPSPLARAFSLSSLSHPYFPSLYLSTALPRPPLRPYPPICLSSSSSFLIRPRNHPHGRLLSVIRTKHPIGRV